MTTEAMTLETEKAPWWVYLMGGILAIILGVALFAAPARTAVMITYAFGFYWIFSGILTLVGMFIDHSAWGWKLFIGILSILAGLAVVQYPLISTKVLPQIFILILGIQGLIVGTIGLIMAFKGGGLGAGIMGALSIIFGIILIANYSAPGMVITLIWVGAIFAFLGGIVLLFQAFRQMAK
jgi:uncharacterized membrane protein HdeD (DUF308 family)